MLQIDQSKWHVHINFRNNGRRQDVFHSTEDQVDCRHSSGEISTVRISTAGIRTRRLRNANFPSDVLNGVWNTTDASVWVRKSNGLSSGNFFSSIPLHGGQRLRLAMIIPAKHIPSHITVAASMVLVSYDGHPMICYGCSDTSHIYHTCPMRQSWQETAPISTTSSWADRALGIFGLPETVRLALERVFHLTLRVGHPGFWTKVFSPLSITRERNCSRT